MNLCPARIAQTGNLADTLLLGLIDLIIISQTPQFSG